jgi:hypothetical protein
MFLGLENWVVQGILLLLLSVPGVSSWVQGDEVSVTRDAYEQVQEERRGSFTALQELELEYRKLVADIEQKKAAGVLGRELQTLLRRSRTVAQQLRSLQGTLRGLDRRVVGERGKLMRKIEGEVRRLELSLVGSGPIERLDIVDDLNALKRERTEIESTDEPSSVDVEGLLSSIEETRFQSPDEARAAADELDDTEEQVHLRLRELKGRIEELRQSRVLMQRARSFAQQERLFEDQTRNRRLTVRPSPKRSSSDSTSTVNGENEAPIALASAGVTEENGRGAVDGAEGPEGQNNVSENFGNNATNAIDDPGLHAPMAQSDAAEESTLDHRPSEPSLARQDDTSG